MTPRTLFFALPLSAMGFAACLFPKADKVDAEGAGGMVSASSTTGTASVGTGGVTTSVSSSASASTTATASVGTGGAASASTTTTTSVSSASSGTGAGGGTGWSSVKEGQATTANGSNAPSLSLTVDAPIEPGDLIVAACGTTAATALAITPETNPFDMTALGVQSMFDLNSEAFWGVATSTAPNVTLVFDFSAMVQALCSAQVFRGGHAKAPSSYVPQNTMAGDPKCGPITVNPGGFAVFFTNMQSGAGAPTDLRFTSFEANGDWTGYALSPQGGLFGTGFATGASQDCICLMVAFGP